MQLSCTQAHRLMSYLKESQGVLPARVCHRRVWRVAFFSRLEERKGIKVFVDALNLLDADALALNQVPSLLADLVFPIHSPVQLHNEGCAHARSASKQGEVRRHRFWPAFAGVQCTDLRQGRREWNSLIQAPG